MRSTVILRIIAIVAGTLLLLSDVRFLGGVIGSGVYPPPKFLIMYGIVPLLALPIYLLSRRLGKWSVVALWSIFLFATSGAVWSVWSWCTPLRCGERSFWRIIEVQVVMDPLVVLAFALALLAHAQHALGLRLQPPRDTLEARS